MNNNKTYQTLEPSYVQTFSQDGKPIGFSTDSAISLFASTSFLYVFGIMISVVAAGVMYMIAGATRIKASEQAIRKSNEIIKRTTIGLLGVLSLFVIIYTFNKDLLTGDVGLSALKSSSAVGGGTGGGVGPTPTKTSTSCADPKTVIASLSSPGGVCGGTKCSALSGCGYAKYESIIRSEAGKAGVAPSLVISIMCKESKANPVAQGKNPNGTFDCGLMQVNQQSACDAASLDPATNIARGVAEIKKKINSSNQVYQNIPPILGALASYNCCANGTVPNAPSADCTQVSGFPYTIPKWACPINPGDATSNMCAVKSYACDIYACVQDLDGV